MKVTVANDTQNAQSRHTRRQPSARIDLQGVDIETLKQLEKIELLNRKKQPDRCVYLSKDEIAAILLDML